MVMMVPQNTTMGVPEHYQNTIALSSCIQISPTIILLYQQATIMLLSIFASFILKPFRMPLMASNLLASLLSAELGHRLTHYSEIIFPSVGNKMLNLYAGYGFVLQMFYFGLQIDLKILKHPQRKIICIGIAVVLFPLALTQSFAYLISKINDLDDKAKNSLLYIGFVQSMSSFPDISCFLHELKIINSEFSRVAFSCAMISGFICYFCKTISFEILKKQKDYNVILAPFYYTLVIFIVVFIIRPRLHRIIERTPMKQNINKGKVYALIITSLLLFAVSRKLDIRAYFGTFLLGIMIPSSSPLGSTLIKKLHLFTTWSTLPVYYNLIGPKVDIFSVSSKTALYTESMIFLGWTGKFLGALLPALYYNMSSIEAILLGITMTIQGLVEISYTRLMSTKGLFDNESYSVMFISLLAITIGSVATVRFLYDSSLKYKLHYERNIQQSALTGEIRILACLHTEENVPSLIHLLKAISHPKDSSTIASIIYFTELVGRSTPIIVSHIEGYNMSESSLVSQRMVSVLKQFERDDRGIISIHPYTVTSHYESMHVDVCMRSVNNRTSLIIIPFHEHFSAGVNINLRTVNRNILENAPCSVGIIIDRGTLGGMKYVFENWVSYNVVVLFFDGVDDREALALGERMLGNPTVNLTVIRFLNIHDKVKRRFDDKMVNEFMPTTTYNCRMTFIQEDVTKCLDVVRVFEEIQDKYDLIILGKRHDNNLLLKELSSCDTFPELGTIGDIFFTSNYGGKATILVLKHPLQNMDYE